MTIYFPVLTRESNYLQWLWLHAIAPSLISNHHQHTPSIVPTYPNFSHVITSTELNDDWLLSGLLECLPHFLFLSNVALSIDVSTILFWCTEYTCFLCSEPPNAQWSRFSFWRNKRSHLHLKGYLPSIKLIATITGFTLFYLFSSSLTQPHFSSRNNLPLCIFVCGSFCWVVLQDICMTHFLATFWHYFKCYLAIHLFCRMWAHTCT